MLNESPEVKREAVAMGSTECWRAEFNIHEDYANGKKSGRMYIKLLTVIYEVE